VIIIVASGDKNCGFKKPYDLPGVVRHFRIKKKATKKGKQMLPFFCI